MDVVLIQPPRYKRKASKRSQPQLGLAYIASFLVTKGMKVKIIDGLLSDRTVEDITEEVRALSPLAIGVTTMSEDRFNAIELCNRIKSRLSQAIIFAGGPHFSYSASDALKNVQGLDAIVIGEGELTSWELLQNFVQNRNVHSFHDVKGCAFRNEKGKVKITSPREPILDLEQIPDIPWHLFDMDKYQGTLSAEEKTRAVGIISSRGCPYQCVFCSNSLTRRVRYRNPTKFVDEIELLHRQYGLQGLNFQDDSFTANARHVTQICEEILSRCLKIRWYCSLRINNVSRDLLRLMKEAGCVALGYGIETGSDRLLKIIKKGITTEHIREALKITKELGFKHVSFFLMTSLPGETLQDIRTSFEFMSEMNSLFYDLPVRKVLLGGPTIIYPGTEIERIARQNGNVFPEKFSWNTYYETDKADVFQSNPYLPHFENPSLSLEQIKTFVLKLKIKWGFLNLFTVLTQARSAKEIGQITIKAFKAFYSLLKIKIKKSQPS